MKIEEYSFPSATGVCTIFGNTYTPDGDVKGVVVIHHGMAEHQQRYREFIEFLTNNGYAVFMHDMANHGKSNQDFALTGYFGKADGYKGLVEDYFTTFKRAKVACPDKPIIVMGHSMGSFIVRCFTAWHNDAGFTGAIYMGTGGSNPIAGIGDKLSSAIAKMAGDTKKVKLLDTMTFGSYGKKTPKRTNFDWLTRDESIVDEYIADDYCGFLFTAQGMNDLVKLNIAANTDEWYNAVPKELAILVTSGAEDPVGEYGKGIEEIKGRLATSGHFNAEVKLYDGARHEILNEINKKDVYDDILSWLDKTIS